MDMMNILFPALIFTGIGVLSATILFLAARFFSVKVDERAKDLRDALPGVNCGACGFVGCDDYAKALNENDETKTNLCTPGGDSVSKEISTILGKAFEDVIEQVAFVACEGNCDKTTDIMEYDGISTCLACNMMYSGKGLCNFTCLGYGDCVKVCKYGALKVEGDLAIIDRSLCSGCGACARVCPNNLIKVVNATSKVYVGCSNKTAGNLTRKVCAVGCIGCKICVKKCPEGAISVTDNVAYIDDNKCTNCKACLDACPRKIIRVAG